MPISNLTDAPKSFMRLGMIRKGELKEFTRQDGSKGTKPVDLDYFRVTFAVGKLHDEIEAAFRSAYGDRPTELNVRFASPVISEVFDANYECYKQGGMIAKAGSNEHGAYWIFYRHPETSEVLVRNGQAVGSEGRAFVERPIDLAAPIYRNSKGEPVLLEPVGRLQVVIPEVAHLAVGYFEFQPKSPRDIRNIAGELGMYSGLAQQYGNSITGIPFVLGRRKEQITKNIKGKLSQGESWPVHLTAGGQWGRQAIEMIERMALPEFVDAEARDVTETMPLDEFEEFLAQPDPFTPPAANAVAVPATTPAPLTVAVPASDGHGSVTFLVGSSVSTADLRKQYAVEATAASKVVKTPLPKISMKSTDEQIQDAIAGIRALVAASS